MKSRIQVTLSSILKNQPIIEVLYTPTSDARDILLSNFRYGFDYKSNLCFINFGDAYEGVSRWEVIPIGDDTANNIFSRMDADQLQWVIKSATEAWKKQMPVTANQ